MTETVRVNRFKGVACFSPLAGGILSCVALVFLPSTEMRLWPVRGMLVYAVAVGLLVQIVLTVALLFRRAWAKALLSAVAAGVLFFATVFVLLIGGPVPDAVARRTADAVGVPQERLACLGGCLTRESTILFKLDGALVPPPEFEPIPDLPDIRGRVSRTLARFGQDSANAPSCRILKRNLDASTVLAVETPSGWFVVYYGNFVL